MKLTFWQRIKRRLSLLGGSYTHPDGTIELDIDAAAGIDPTADSEEVQDEKMAHYYAHQRATQKVVGAIFVALVSYFLATRLGVFGLEAAAVAVLTGYGLYLLMR